MTISTNFTVLHTDHGITEDQMAHIQNQIASGATEGVLLETGATNWPITLPVNLGSVPCGLHGPAMDDEPVPESEVSYKVRFSAEDPRTWSSRMVGRPFRPVDYVQVIGIQKEDGSFLLFTVYGGPLAPQNPADPTCQDVPTSTKFWADHALSL